MKKIIFFIFFLLSSQVVFAQPLSDIIDEIPAYESIKCKFRQEKQISDMVLKSSGDFVFEKGKGVIFYTTYPIKNTTAYTTREYRQINNIINAISNKDYSRLEKDFEFVFDKPILKLHPKQSTPAYNYLKAIEIQTGKTKIDKIVISTCDGTKTTIYFE